MALDNNSLATTSVGQESSFYDTRTYYEDMDPIDAYIYNEVVDQIIDFQAFLPDEITDNISAQFSQQSVPGRSNPFQGYEYTGPKTVSFTMQIHDDLCKENIVALVRQLKALAYPEYGSYIIPPKCFVRLGIVIGMKGICKDVSVVWKKPYRDQKYLAADVTMTFEHCIQVPFSASRVNWWGDRDAGP